MASTEHLIVQPLDSLSTPSSCKKRPNHHLHIFDLLPPSPKRHSSSSFSSSSSEYPSASPVSSSCSTSTSPSPSSSNSCAFSASSFQFFDEHLSELDASCLVEFDETDPNMSSTQQELLSEMMKTLEKVLEDGNLQKSTDMEAVVDISTPSLSSNPSPLSRSTVCGVDNNTEEDLKAVEIQSCELAESSTFSEYRDSDMSCADLPFASCSNPTPKLVGDSSDTLCSTSPDSLEISALPSEDDRRSQRPNLPHSSRISTEEDACLNSDVAENNSGIDRRSPSHEALSSEASPVQTSLPSSTNFPENIVHGEIDDDLLDETFGQSEEAHDASGCTLRFPSSSEACDELLRDLLAEATGSDLQTSSTTAFTYDTSDHEIKVDEWPLFFDNEGTEHAGSSESDNHALESCSFGYEDDESSMDVVYNPLETSLF